MIHSDPQGSDYKDDGSNILLDANENAFGPSLEPDDFHDVRSGHENNENNSSRVNIDFSGLHRYPDPYVILDFGNRTFADFGTAIKSKWNN